MSTKTIGDRAEEYAYQYLVDKGYSILERNYRFKRAEIDLIVKKEDTLIFVEVKFRSNASFGHPESFVDDRKADLIGMAATEYCEQVGWQGRIQFDIVAITGKKIEHFEDSFN